MEPVTQPRNACSKLTIETLEQGAKYVQSQQWGHRKDGRSGVFIVNLEHISHFVLVFLLFTLSMNIPAGVCLKQTTPLQIFIYSTKFIWSSTLSSTLFQIIDQIRETCFISKISHITDYNILKFTINYLQNLRLRRFSCCGKLLWTNLRHWMVLQK